MLRVWVKLGSIRGEGHLLKPVRGGVGMTRTLCGESINSANAIICHRPLTVCRGCMSELDARIDRQEAARKRRRGDT